MADVEGSTEAFCPHCEGKIDIIVQSHTNTDYTILIVKPEDEPIPINLQEPHVH